MATITITGEKQLKRNLTRLERKVLPRAMANALNRTATEGRKQTIKEVARMEKRHPKSFRSIIRVVRRARAKIREFAIVGVFRRQDVTTARLSKPFHLKSARRGAGMYRRRIPGVARTKGRPETSSPNLPIYPGKDFVRDRRDSIAKMQCGLAMKTFYPAEVREQIKKLVAKL